MPAGLPRYARNDERSSWRLREGSAATVANHSAIQSCADHMDCHATLAMTLS